MLKKIMEKIKDRKQKRETRIFWFVDDLYSVNSMIEEAKKYQDYTDDDYQTDVEIKTNDMLSEVFAELSNDSTYYHVDHDGVSKNNDLSNHELNRKKKKIKSMLDKDIQSWKKLVENLPNLKRKKKELIRSCKERTGISYKKIDRKIQSGKLVY